MISDKRKPADLVLRKPLPADGLAVHGLIHASPPLDVNSSYCYYLLVRHFAATCVIAEVGGIIAGCITAYLRPDQPDILFVWQVAVAAEQRGQGMAGHMLDALFSRPDCRSVAYVETTVSASNRASRRTFERFAERHHASLEDHPFLAASHFGPGSQHEAEGLLRIGPISPDITTPSA